MKVANSGRWGAMGNLLQDLRYGLRMLAKSPGFTLVASLTLALGVGANTALFSFFYALLWRPLPVKEPRSVVKIFMAYMETAQGDRLSASSYLSYLDYRDGNQVFSDLAAYSNIAVGLQVSENAPQPERAYAQVVSPNYFRTLGLEPYRGSDFQNTDRDTLEAILSWRLWARSFHSDPAVLGKSIKVNGQLLTVVGVGPAGFGGLEVDDRSDLFLPLAALARLQPDSNRLACRDCTWLNLVGRLKPGIDRAKAEAGLRTLSAQIERAHPELRRNITLVVLPGTLMPRLNRKMAPVFTLLVVAVAAILLISCANVANLLLARASTRQKEIGVRLALGASPGRVIRQLLTESALLALVAGAVSLLLTLWLQDVIPILTGSQRPLNLNVNPDIRVLGFAFAISLCGAIICGLAPALQLTRSDLVPALKGEWSALRARWTRSRLRNSLVVAQVALSLTLLIAAGLLVRGLQKAALIHPGFEGRNVLVAPLALGDLGYSATKATQVFGEIEGRLSGLPGVRTVALARIVPLGNTYMAAGITVEGDTSGQNVPVGWNVVSRGYFQTLAIPLLLGRDLGREDTSGARVAIVNQTMARRFWPSENPIGRRLKLGHDLDRKSVV